MMTNNVSQTFKESQPQAKPVNKTKSVVELEHFEQLLEADFQQSVCKIVLHTSE